MSVVLQVLSVVQRVAVSDSEKYTGVSGCGACLHCPRNEKKVQRSEVTREHTTPGKHPFGRAWTVLARTISLKQKMSTNLYVI